MDDLITVGIELPGFSEQCKELTERESLFDYDLVLWKTNLPYYERQSDYPSARGESLLSYGGSSRLKADIRWWNNELKTYVEEGNIVFVILDEPENTYTLENITFDGSGRNARKTFHTGSLYSSYDFLPIDISWSFASGSNCEFIGNPVFTDFNNVFGKRLSYKTYFKKNSVNEILYTTKNKDRITGGIIRLGKGALVLLPNFEFDYEECTYERGENTYWRKPAIEEAKKLLGILRGIQKAALSQEIRPVAPEWVNEVKYKLEEELSIEKDINTLENDIENIQNKIKSMNSDLEQYDQLKGLLYAQGNDLEDAVRSALSRLDIEANTYHEDDLEIDIYTEQEELILVGEVEGKDTKAIDISKFRQLLDNVNAIFYQKELDNKPKGILFGNPMRLIPVEERDKLFTDKCKSRALEENISIIYTPDLYQVVVNISKTDDGYKEKCKDTILRGGPGLLEFPNLDND